MANDSYVVVGSRRNLPQIYVGAGDGSETGSLRYRTSDSSVGRGSDSGCGTPEADVADVLISPQFRNRYEVYQSLFLDATNSILRSYTVYDHRLHLIYSIIQDE